MRAGLVKKPPLLRKKNALPETKMFLNKKVFALAGIDLTPARTCDHAQKLMVHAGIRPRNVAADYGTLAR